MELWIRVSNDGVDQPLLAALTVTLVEMVKTTFLRPERNKIRQRQQVGEPDIHFLMPHPITLLTLQRIPARRGSDFCQPKLSF
jgi:hypothetical protein